MSHGQTIPAVPATTVTIGGMHAGGPPHGPHGVVAVKLITKTLMLFTFKQATMN